MFKENISLEVLAIGAKTPLVKLCETYVKDMRKTWETYPTGRPDIDEWKRINGQFLADVKRILGANLTIDIYNASGPMAGVMSAIWFKGHAGSRYFPKPEERLVFDDSVSIRDTLIVDLKNVKVSGHMADILQFKMYYSEFMMFSKKFYTDDEMVATMLHEFGHVFNSFMTLGDYVWLNYYLTDGIDILMGKKQDILKLELFNQRWLNDNIPTEIHEQFTNDRTEDNAKKVVFSAMKSLPRHHLTNNAISANRREEQLSDMFAARLGYGRALVSGNYKYDRLFGDPELIGRKWYAETAKVLVGLVMLPVAVIGILNHDVVGSKATRYDDPMQRNIRVRTDLVAQLKNPGPLDKDGIVADIEAIDDIIKEYTKNPSIYDGIINFFRPDIRKQRQNTQVEDDLETLLNNDLFIQAHKLSKL